MCEYKEKQKNVTKLSGSDKAEINWGRIYSDISTIKPKDGKEIIPRSNCHIMVDERTGNKVLNICDTKVIW